MAIGLPENTLIPTPDGPMRIADMKLGMPVFAANGRITTVTKVIRNEHPEPIYEMTLKDGRKLQCTKETVLDAYRWTHVKGQRAKTPLHITLEELMERGVALHRLDDESKPHRWNKFHYANCGVVQYPVSDVPVDPYVVGAFLGDGNIGNYAKILSFSCSPEDEETVARIAELIGASGYVRPSEKNFTWMFLLSDQYHIADSKRKYIHIQDIFSDLPELLHNADEKRIPAKYKYASESQRWALLQGMMDTDGSIGAITSGSTNRKKKAPLSISSVSPGLIDDLCEIIWSLGLEARVHMKDRRGQKHRASNGKIYIRKSIEYTVVITCPNDIKHRFFRLERKRQRAYEIADTKVRRDYRYQSIVDIQPAGISVPTVALTVSDPQHSFLANDYLVICDASA